MGNETSSPAKRQGPTKNYCTLGTLYDRTYKLYSKTRKFISFNFLNSSYVAEPQVDRINIQ